MLAWFFWNPDSVAFTLPIIKHPITWYGILFALSFFIGYYLLLAVVRLFLYSHPYFVDSDLINLKEIMKGIKKLEISFDQKAFKRNEQVKELNRLIDQYKIEGLPIENKGMMRFLPLSACTRLKNRYFFEQVFGLSVKTLKKKSAFFAEKLTTYILISVVIGARLGHILFYENGRDYLLQPLRVLKTWEGGLASHGAIIGVVCGATLFYRKVSKEYPGLSMLRLFDLLTVPALFSSTLIRLGNFMNQEILGTETTLPWGIIFGNPADGSSFLPRHPAQLYEAGFYLLVFFIFARFFMRLFPYKGLLTSVLFTALFLFRFAIEFIKNEQSYWMTHSTFTMGQLLSIPFIFLGIFLFIKVMFLNKKNQSFLKIPPDRN